MISSIHQPKQNSFYFATVVINMNVYGRRLKTCSMSPLTGYRRSGSCDVDANDSGTHTVCAIVTKPFLRYTYAQGNDLITPRPGFPGLKPGNKWCLCALRWLEAYEAGVAPPILGEATNIHTLRYIPSEVMTKYLLDV